MPANELPPVLIADSITRIGNEAAGAVVVNGSHGGIYAAYLAAKLRVYAAIFNDAGVGRDSAGIAGLDYLAGLDTPAATVGHDTARIGSGSQIDTGAIIGPEVEIGARCHIAGGVDKQETALQEGKDGDGDDEEIDQRVDEYAVVERRRAPPRE